MKTEKMLAAVKALSEDATGMLGFGYLDLTTGETCTLNGQEKFPTASVFKVFVLTELYRRIQQGSLSEAQTILVTPDKASPGSGILSKMAHSVELSLHDHAVLMMTLSDNTSSDLLFDLVGSKSIRKHIIEPLGLEDTRIDLSCSGMIADAYKVKPYRNNDFFCCNRPEHDDSTPSDMLRLWKALYNHELLEPDTTDRVFGLMRPSAGNMRIERYLPRGLKVARKTGSLDRLANDTGIVFAKNGAYAVVIFYNGNRASEEEYNRESPKQIFADELIAQISKAVYEIHTS